MNIIVKNENEINFPDLSSAVNISRISFNGIKISLTTGKHGLFVNFDMMSEDYKVIGLSFPFILEPGDIRKALTYYSKMPARGLVDQGIPMVMAVTEFYKYNTDNYIVYCENMRNKEDKNIYAFIFDMDQYVQIMNVLHRVMECENFEYYMIDKYIGLKYNKIISLYFSSDYITKRYYAPEKDKLFGFKGNIGLAQVEFNYKDKPYNLLISVKLSKEDYKHLNPTNRAKGSHELALENNTYLITDLVTLEYKTINKCKHVEKQCLIGLNQELKEVNYFLIANPSYRSLIKSIRKTILVK